MAESSSTAANSGYDVFINHRGPDVKKTFASHLYRRLLSYGLRVFLDQPELQRGDYLTPQIEDAIRSASVHVAIFSPGYADSIWCLNELVQMLESKAPIIPVFYHVKPAELRWTRGKKRSYAEALENLERKTECDLQTPRHHSTTIENWRNALSKVADISGFELEACNSDEGELVDKVVEGVLKKVKKPALEVAKHPRGLADKVKDFENLVLLTQQQRGKLQICGIVGLGGVGKTTLAREFFNRKSSGYSRSCFLSDTRDHADKGSLNSLQRELLKNLTGSDNPINSVAEGIGMLRKHLSSTNALVIIDDVDHEDQVYALLPDQSVLHSDSLILITSRRRDVLIKSGVKESSIYNLTGLSKQHSLELFCLHSFNQPHPLPEFESLVDKFLEACVGLPLSLKVFGALLNGEDTSYWEYQLDKLQRILPKEIKQTLQISYDALDMEEQQVFLDIACFFIGEDRDMAVRVWDNGLCGFLNIQNKCLVEVNSENKIKMHDHLRDLGREIAKASGLPRRLWRWTENDIDDFLQESSVIPVRGIRLVRSEYKYFDGDDAFGGIRMRRLELLNTEGDLVDSILTKVQHPNLIWLRWNNCPYSSLPSSISMKKLRVLQVQGEKLKTLWENESQAPLQLRELRIDAFLSTIPKSIGQLKHLEWIVIRPRSNAAFDLCSPFHREELYMSKESELKERALERLPDSFCKLIKLQFLDLRRCCNLTMSSETLGNISTLEHLDLRGCGKIEVLPWQVAHQRSLKQLLLVGTNLKELPSAIGELSNLEVLAVGPLRDTLPPSLCYLKNLKELRLYECKELECLPPSLGDLKNLKQLKIWGCNALKCLPPSLGDLKNLKELKIWGCNALKCLPPSLGDLKNLKELKIWGCNALKCLPPSLGDLKNLKELKIWGCNALKCLPPSLGDLKNLKELKIWGCNALKCLPPSLGDLKNLKELWLCGCKKLECLPASLGLLIQWVEFCPLISKLPFKKEVKGERETLTDLDCILPHLQKLMVKTTGISEVSFAEGVCSNLRNLEVYKCNNVVEVGTLPNTLISLCFSGCDNLRKINYVPAKLQYLYIVDCRELEELPGVVETLVTLDVRGCVKLKSIRELGKLTKLRHLWVRGCSELEEVEGIQDCMSLLMLVARECPKLQWSAGVVEQLRQRLKCFYV